MSVQLPMRRKGDLTRNRLHITLAVFAIAACSMCGFTAFEAHAKWESPPIRTSR